jgi:hypothetical protein
LGILQTTCPEGYEVQGKAARDSLRVAAFAVWVVALLYALVWFCARGKINLAISVNEVAATFTMDTPQIFLVPIVQSLISALWVAAWVASSCFMLSMVPSNWAPTEAYATYAEAYGSHDPYVAGKCTSMWPSGGVYADNDNCEIDEATGAAKCWRCTTPRVLITLEFMISFFIFLWNNAFMIAFEECTIAGAVGVWFFAVHDRKRGSHKVTQSLGNVVRYHSGSLLLGSFIIACVQFVRKFLAFFEKQAQANQNRVATIVLKALIYTTWCLEKCLRFLTKNAYIQIALLGTNFCSSAKRAISLISQNKLRFGVVMSLGWVVQRIGGLSITIVTATIGYFIMQGLNPDANVAVPMIVFVVIGYMVGRLFMAVFQLAVDTALQCFFVVEDYGGESAEQDKQYVPKQLAVLLCEKTTSIAG